MVQRLVADKFVSGEVKLEVREQPHVLFAGFNALTKSEEVILSTLVDQGVAEFTGISMHITSITILRRRENSFVSTKNIRC